MARNLRSDLENLKREILTLGAMVEEATNLAITALLDRRPELAQEVIDDAERIDHREVDIENLCLQILALHQPVAVDLRFIIAALKVNNDLERMGDCALNIAERTKYLATHEPLRVTLDFDRMTRAVQEMLRDSLDALVHLDTKLAVRVCQRDDEVDQLNREAFTRLQELMQDDPATVRRAVHALSTSRHLERIADLATNIAEDVIFLVEGEVVRHRSDADLESLTS